VRVVLMEPSYFCEISAADAEPVVTSGRFAISTKVQASADESIYFGSLRPQEIWISAKVAGDDEITVAASPANLPGEDLELPVQ